MVRLLTGIGPVDDVDGDGVERGWTWQTGLTEQLSKKFWMRPSRLTKEFVLLRNSTRYPQGGAPFRVRVVIDGQPYLLYPEQIVRDLLISEGLTEALPKGSSTNSPASVLVDEDEVK